MAQFVAALGAAVLDLLPVLGASGQSPSAPGDPALLAEGWERRTMVEPARIEEFTELYVSLGFQVKSKNSPKRTSAPPAKDARRALAAPTC